MNGLLLIYCQSRVAFKIRNAVKVEDTDFSEFTKLLNKLSISHDFEKIDVDKLRSKAPSYDYLKISEEKKLDYEKYDSILTNDLDIFVSNYNFC